MFGAFFLFFLCCLQQNVASSSSSSGRRLMLWMCLEDCSDSSNDINNQIDSIYEHRDVISAVSFEKYTLGANSTLVTNSKLTDVSATIKSMDLEAWPLLSSYPHPPEFIDWMREVFADPDPFINACISEAQKNSFAGYNLDWEPTDAVKEEDGVNYAQFINYFSDQLHSAGFLLTVDIATWSSIWNFDLLAKTSADRFISMSTYTATDSSFTSQLEKLVNVFGPEKSGVGLETVRKYVLSIFRYFVSLIF
jgi:spore germination protein YaaH